MRRRKALGLFRGIGGCRDGHRVGTTNPKTHTHTHTHARTHTHTHAHTHKHARPLATLTLTFLEIDVLVDLMGYTGKLGAPIWLLARW